MSFPRWLYWRITALLVLCVATLYLTFSGDLIGAIVGLATCLAVIVGILRETWEEEGS